MTKKKHTKVVIEKTVDVPEEMEILRREGNYAIVRIRIDDLERVRLLKLPEELRAYRREIQRRYRKRLREKKKQSPRKESDR